MEQGSRHKQAHLQMEENNCTESILKYASPSNDNYFLSTARQSLPERLASLKAHVFSNSGNANSLSMPNSEQTNCFAGTKIYSSDPSVAPPSQDNISQASRETCTEVDASSNLECSGSVAHLRQEQSFIEERSDFTNTINAEFNSNNFESNNSEHGSTIDHQTFSHQPTNTQRFSSRNGTFVTNLRKNNIILKRKALPIVVVTPALEDICDFDSDNMDSKIENSNGDVDGMLNDCLDTCSLSSVCSEDDILTDDEPSESDSASQIEEKTDKASNWKKIRRMIHWSPFVQNFKKRYPWVQLAGHQGCFKAGENGTILKKTTEKEKDCLIKLMKDILRPYVPEYKREVERCGEKYLEMQDLLQEFDSPCVMDCKIGVRTYLEEELAKARSKPRKDLYQKMVEVSPTEPTDTENKAKAITKPRYMQWREKLSSSATLGFRIEGIKKSDQKPNKDFKKTKTKDDVDKVFTEYIENDPQLRSKYLRRLKAIRATLEASGLFKSHEVIGSSLLFVHDLKGHASVWMIDFGKTVPLPEGAVVNHRSEWKEGNHEDGYLWGLDKMIEVWAQR